MLYWYLDRNNLFYLPLNRIIRVIRVMRSRAVWLQNPIVCFECSSPLWCGQTVNRFAWLVRISGVEYFDGKRQASKFARFKMLMNKKIIKIDRDIGKRPTLGCHLVSCRSGDHDWGFQIKGQETIALVFSQPAFLFFQYWQNLAIIGSMFVQNDTFLDWFWHVPGCIFLDHPLLTWF